MTTVVSGIATCSVRECVSAVSAKGLCKNHYARARRAKNLEEFRARDRENYHKNRDREIAGMRRRYHEGGGREKMLRYIEANKDTLRAKQKAMRCPDSLEGWAKAFRHFTIVNVSCRRLRNKVHGTAVSLDVAREKVRVAALSGDVSFTDPICAPSPDRIRNDEGYSDDNVQVVPRWLNYAYHDWDKTAVEAAILAWAARRLGE